MNNRDSSSTSPSIRQQRGMSHRAGMSRRSFLRLAGCGMAALGAATLGLGLSGCGTQAAAEANDLKTVRIGYSGDAGTVKLSYTPAIAYARGILDKNLASAGYKPEFLSFTQAGPALNEALASSSIDVAQYADFAALSARSKGVGLKAFAVADTSTAYAILASDASGIQSVADLRGKTVAVGLGTIPYRYLLLALQKAGIPVDEVNVVNAPGNDAPAMVASGAVDASVGMFALIYQHQQKAGRIIATSLDDPSLSATGDFFAREDFIASDRAAVVAITRSLKEAWQYAQGNPDEARQILTSSGTPIDAVRAEFPDDAFPQFNPEITDEIVDKIQGVEQFMEQNALIKSHVDAHDFVDTTIYQEA